MKNDYSDLQKLAYFLIKNYQMQVLSSKQEPSKYFTFSDGITMGYVQKEELSWWFSFGSVCMPNKDSWTWHQIFKNVDALPKYAMSTLHTYNPFLNDDKYKYTNVTQFINYQKRFRKEYWPITIEEIDLYIK